ncbi:MAG TPA: acyl carrier protein [Longimicrobiales bacterium]|nr:acyl carrier protein [Longimicrobiales bacterium]
MTREEVERIMREVLAEAVPGVDADALDPDVPIRDQAEIDSMDFLAFVLAIERRLGVEVPPASYPLFATLRRASERALELTGAESA